MSKDLLISRIEELSPKAWSAMGEEQHAGLHELVILYEQLLELEDDPYFILENKSRIHAHLKEYTKAEECLQKIIRISPESITGWSLLAEVQFETGKFAEALNSLDTVIANSLVSDFRYDFRAKINRALGNMEAAVKDQQIYDDYQAREQAKWDDPNHYYHYK